MAYIVPFLDMQILLLLSPLLTGIAIFGYLLWSDNRYYKKKEKSANKQIIQK